MEQRVVLGTQHEVDRRLQHSAVSSKVNTSGIERQNGKLRQGQSRLRRKTLGFGHTKRLLLAALCLSLAYDQFCRPHLGLRQRKRGRPPKRPGLRRYQQRTPMMALGKADHPWSVRELLLTRVPGRNVRCFFVGA
ncbi:MAG: hypothetical protein ACYDDF_03140 [Thermoplasmatota archaeon]